MANGYDRSQILATADGGFTWEPRFEYPPDLEGSLTRMVAMPNGEAWACGGGPDPENPFLREAHFWHTMNFGETWQCVQASAVLVPSLPRISQLTTRIAPAVCTRCLVALRSICLFRLDKRTWAMQQSLA